MKKRLLHTLVRIVVSVSLVSFLLWRADLPEMWSALKSAILWLMVVALALAFLRVVVSAYRWQVMLSARQMKVSLPLLTNYYLVGGFFNLFLPTVLGGDVMRGYELARSSGKVLDTASTVIMERIVGFLALFVICWLSLPFGYHLMAGTNVPYVVAGASGAFAVFVFVILNPKVMSKIISLTSVIKRWNLPEKLRAAVASLHSLGRSRDIMFKAFLISLVFQFIGILSTYCISEALRLHVPFTYFLIVMPVIWVLMMLPISISGLGVREAAFVLFFTQVGVPEEQAILLSLLFFALTVVIGIVGGVLFAWGGYRRGRTAPIGTS